MLTFVLSLCLVQAEPPKGFTALFNGKDIEGWVGGDTADPKKVALKTPMRDVSFQKNEVRFTVDISGAARVFTGTVQGGTLSGAIARGSDKAAGRFSLKYVE